MTTVAELASIVRSKNAAPFDITFELFFDDHDSYLTARDSGRITPDTVAQLYSVDRDVVAVYYCDEVDAIKITMPREHSAGSRDDTDVLGAQQHGPLLRITLS